MLAYSVYYGYKVFDPCVMHFSYRAGLVTGITIPYSLPLSNPYRVGTRTALIYRDETYITLWARKGIDGDVNPVASLGSFR